MLELVLASSSPSRKRLLEAAGVTARIVVSNVDEEDPIYQAMSPREMVLALAIIKAHTVREMIDEPVLILACDSTFEFNDKSMGKPLYPEVAKERIREMSGNSGYLHTGHCLIDLNREIEITDIATTKVNFTELSEDEISSYVSSGEPLNVAGAFTLDGQGSAFISSIEGDFTNVIGLSVPMLRKMIGQLGYSWTEFTNNLTGAEN